MNKSIDISQLLISRLGNNENIESFNCGDTDLNDFILNEAPLYLDNLLAVSYIAKIETKVVAYFSLANDRVSLADFESKTDFNKFRKHRFVFEKLSCRKSLSFCLWMKNTQELVLERC